MGDLSARRIRHHGRDRLVRFGLVLNNPADEIVRRGLCRFEMFERSLRPPKALDGSPDDAASYSPVPSRRPARPECRVVVSSMR
jgi:hypothetical protein